MVKTCNNTRVFTIGCKQQELLDTELFECVMNLEYGLLMGVLGILLITIVGFMIAYIVANNVIEKEKKKKKKTLNQIHNYKV